MSDHFIERARTAPEQSRRTVLRAAAWSLPAVSLVSAAPAFAATGCTKYTVTLVPTSASNQVTADRRTWTQSYQPSSAPSGAGISVTGTFTAPGTGNAMTVLNLASDDAEKSFGVRDTVHGQALNLSQRRGNGVHYAESPQDHPGAWTFVFSRPVSNLRFTLSDIDNAEGDFNDRAYLTPGAGSTASVVSRGSNIPTSATGTSASKALRSSSSLGIPLTSDAGSATYQFAGTTDRFSITYWNNLKQAGSNGWVRVDNNQQILLSSISFSYEVCA